MCIFTIRLKMLRKPLVFLSITHYRFMGNHLKDKTTCWQLSVAIKMNFCVKVETNSVRDNADHGIEAAAAGCDKADS